MSDCKVQIGSKYEGPSLDRPCLRQLPPGWHLEDSKPTPIEFLSADAWLFIICVVIGVCLLVQAVLAVAR